MSKDIEFKRCESMVRSDGRGTFEGMNCGVEFTHGAKESASGPFEAAVELSKLGVIGESFKVMDEVLSLCGHVAIAPEVDREVCDLGSGVEVHVLCAPARV